MINYFIKSYLYKFTKKLVKFVKSVEELILF